MATPEMVERDLCLAKRSLSVHRFALSGGEPLLNPQIESLMEIAKHSGIAKEVMVLTNGSLLDKQPDSFWEKLDVLRISRYPGQITDEQLERWESCARSHGAEFMVISIDRFYKTLTRENRSNSATEDTFRRCIYFHKCSAIFDGYYFPCPQAFFIPRMLKVDPYIDALSLEKMTAESLAKFMSRKTPLFSCKRCSYETETPWKQTTRDQWIEESTE